MIIKSANVCYINEAVYGGYDTIEHRITTDNDEELAFVFCHNEPEYTTVTMWTGNGLHFYTFPTKNVDRKLFKLLWAQFRHLITMERV